MTTPAHLTQQKDKNGLRVRLVHIVSVALTFAGVWVFVNTDGKNGVDRFPLLWFAALLCAPPLSLVCTIQIWAKSTGYRIWAIAAYLLLIPQAIIWLFALLNFWNYL